MSKLGGPFMQNWQKKHLKLYPNRLEFYSKKGNGTINRDQVEVQFESANFFSFIYLLYNASGLGKPSQQKF